MRLFAADQHPLPPLFSASVAQGLKLSWNFMEMAGLQIQWNSIYASFFKVSRRRCPILLIESNYPGARRTRSIVVVRMGGGEAKKNREEWIGFAKLKKRNATSIIFEGNYF